MSEKIHIFDTTLRDGEQAPGSSLEIEEKIEIAKQLSKLNVDVIEAGFPVSSKAQYKAVESIADLVNGPTIAALARCIENDIEKASATVTTSTVSARRSPRRRPPRPPARRGGRAYVHRRGRPRPGRGVPPAGARPRRYHARAPAAGPGGWPACRRRFKLRARNFERYKINRLMVR